VRVLALILLAAAAPQSDDLLDLRYGVSVEREDGEIWCTIRANDAPLRPLLQTLAERAGLTVEGAQRIPAEVRVTVELERRPLHQTTAWVLGSVGLRADRRLDTLSLRVDADGREDLWTEAQTSYLRVLREHPNYDGADRIVLGQALLEEERGNPSAARRHLDALSEAYPESTLVPDVLRRCAESWAAEREWSFAATKWSELLRLEREHTHELVAYRELARCTARLGDSARALHMLDALENLSPAQNDVELQDRLYIRARALVGVGRHHHALESLDEADRWERTEPQKLASLELRAKALAATGELVDASRAWLGFAELALGAEREQGLRRAADLALEAGDELGVLFIERLAVKLGADRSVAAAAREARTRLDLEPATLTQASAIERLARAERLLAAELFEEAAATLDSIRSAAERFGEPERTRFTLAFGRSLAGSAGVDAALDLFREHLEWIHDAENRRRIYLLAAELLEAEDRMDEAIEAYRGRL
jgi:tetratricopeptide (TPR) repeat protein